MLSEVHNKRVMVDVGSMRFLSQVEVTISNDMDDVISIGMHQENGMDV